jgi:hypothetical protein
LVSSWEDPNYGKYTLSTLKEVARVFDVGLLVRFVPFSLLVDWTNDLKPDTVAPLSFNEEQSNRAVMAFLGKAQNANQAYSSISPLDANLAQEFIKGGVPNHA